MKHEKTLTRAFNSIVIIVIIAILTIAVFLVYRTFDKSVKVDVFNYSRELENSVRRTTATEYRRYLLLIDLGKSLGSDLSDEAFSELLEGKSVMLDQDGEIPNLVSSIGYFYKSSPKSALEYDFDSEEWSEINGVFDTREINHGWANFSVDAGSQADDFYIAVENRGERVVFFKLNSFGFINSYARESIESANEEFYFEWLLFSDADARKSIEDYFESGPADYQFRPFRILLGAHKDKQPLIIELPGFFELRRIMEKTEEESSEIKSGKPERPAFMNTGYFVKMTHRSGAYYHDIEYKTAVNYIETVIIFIIIGILFMLLLFQLQRTRLLRSKEKEFVASVTHELRTPLTVIRAAADNLFSGIVSVEKHKVYGGLIIEQSERLGNMIEEILLYSKFEDRRRRPENPVSVNFSNLISQIKPTLDAVAAVDRTSLHWDISGLPESAETHPEVITLIVNNLVTNAINHAYSGDENTDRVIEIRIKFRMLIPDKLEITVEDDGRGIEPRELKRIFNPFYRDAVSRSRQEKGSGLGLFIAQRKAAVSGGKLTVESPYRRIDGSRPSGCRFSLVLPCIVKEHKDV